MATNGVEKMPGAADHGASSNVSLVQSFFAAHPNVRFVRFQYADYSNVLRTRCTTTSRALQIASNPNGGIATGSPVLAIGLQAGGITPEIFQMGNDVWLPDWTTLREFPASEGNALVFCWVEERPKAAEGKEAMLAGDPRAVLQKVVQGAKAKHDVDFLVGIEIEFMLVESPAAQEPIAGPMGTWTSNTLRHPNWKSVVEEAVTQLEKAGVHVWAFNQEGGASLYEISLSPLPPLEAVDAMHFAHETIKTIAANNGVHATMHPKPFETGREIGKHVHMSLSRPELGTTFLAGVLQHFRALCALMLPNMDSYQRANQFGGGSVCWGWRNKLTCINRLQDAYFELRPPDTLANMYLMLAALLGAGLQGVEDGKEPMSKAMDGLNFDGALSEEQRKKWNITQDLPTNLAESLAELKKDELIKRVLGELCFDRYLYNKEKDLEAAKKMSTTERRKILMQHH